MMCYGNNGIVHRLSQATKGFGHMGFSHHYDLRPGQYGFNKYFHASAAVAGHFIVYNSGFGQTIHIRANAHDAGLAILERFAGFFETAVFFAASSSEARRQIQGGGVKLDGEKLADPNQEFAGPEALAGKVLQLGKKTFRRLVAG